MVAPPGSASHGSGARRGGNRVPALVAEIYGSASLPIRAQLIECLLRPLGVMPLVVLADGIFAKVRLRGGWPDLHLRPQDVERVTVPDVRALVEFVDKVCAETVDALAQIVAGAPAMTKSAAATALVSVLIARARDRKRVPLE